jgi:hypothetical protein
MISNQEKMDGDNGVKILHLGFNKCVHYRKVLKLTSQTSKNPIAPAKIDLHEIEVDSGLNWRTLKEKWLTKSRKGVEGFYFSKEVMIGYFVKITFLNSFFGARHLYRYPMGNKTFYLFEK